MNDASLVEQYKSLFRHAALPQHSYEEYQAIIAQTGNVYLQLLSDYLERIPDDAVGSRTIAVGQLMVEIQELLL